MRPWRRRRLWVALRLPAPRTSRRRGIEGGSPGRDVPKGRRRMVRRMSACQTATKLPDQWMQFFGLDRSPDAYLTRRSPGHGTLAAVRPIRSSAARCHSAAQIAPIGPKRARTAAASTTTATSSKLTGSDSGSSSAVAPYRPVTIGCGKSPAACRRFRAGVYVHQFTPSPVRAWWMAAAKTSCTHGSWRRSVSSQSRRYRVSASCAASWATVAMPRSLKSASVAGPTFRNRAS